MTARNAALLDAPRVNVAPSRPAAAVQPRMLCVTDLSPESSKAVTRAVVMARQLDAKLDLLHVVAPEQGSVAFAAAWDRMDVLLKSIRPPACREPVVHIRAGEYEPTIAAVASAAGADLVVLGAESWKPLAPMVETSAARLAALVRRPVLIVKRDSRAPYGAVLIAAEQSAGFSRVFQVASTLRLLESESVSIIHGFESPYRGPLYASGFDLLGAGRNIEAWELAARRRLLQNLEAAGVSSDRFRLLFVQARPLRQVQKAVRQLGPELLVLAARDQAALDRVMRANTGNSLQRHTACDILVVPGS